MPTAQENAALMEQRRLARAGLGPDGKPLSPAARAAVVATGNEDDDFEVEDEDEDEDQDEDLGGGSEDDRDARIAELQAQLDAVQGRVAPTQQQLADYQRMYGDERAARERERTDRDQRIAELQAQLDERNSQLTVEALIPEEVRSQFDPALLNLIVQTADKIAQARAPKIDARAEALAAIDQREANRVVQHRQRVLTDPARGLHQLGTLAYDPAFIAWSKGEDNDVDSVVNSLLSATSTEEVDRYAKIVAKRLASFHEFKGKKSGGKEPDAARRLNGHMRRGPKAKMTQAEVDAKFNEAKRLSRSNNPDDRKRAQAILNELQS